MKKQSLILWISAVVIVFIISYMNKITSADYPITGTIGIEGKKVSYRFEKIYYGNDDYVFSVRSDLTELSGKYFYKLNNDSLWASRELVKDGFLLTGILPKQKPETKLQYYVELYHNTKTISVPDKKYVQITFFGRIPLVISMLQFIFLYGGLVFAVRTGLESFNNNIKTKKFIVILSIIFLTLIALINPLYLTYKYGFINNYVPSIDRLFSTAELLIFVLWVITAIVLFNKSKLKYISLFTAALTLVIFCFFD
ncbi:MAG: hypothetical protein WA440_07650 [Ignavibacteriaceae bacterium]